ncbi:MAG: photosynthetic complex assembly protein PuhC [Pseudomonadota bacterium]
MSHAPIHNPHHHDVVIPRRAVIAAACMAVFAFFIAAFGALTGIGVQNPEMPPIIAEKTLAFDDLGDGQVVVTSGVDNSQVALLTEDNSGFVRNVLRGFGHDRRLQKVPASAPYRVVRFDHRRMMMIDPATGMTATLHGHGQRNMATFATLVPMPNTQMSKTQTPNTLAAAHQTEISQ